MFDRVKSFIFTLLRDVLGIKLKMSDSAAGVLPPLAENILTYYMRMETLKKLEGLALQKQWRVTSVKAYKRRAPSRHEYISASVIDSNNKISHVIIERQIGDPIQVQLESPADDTNIDPSSPGLFSVSNLSISSISSTSSNSDSLSNYDMIAPIQSPGTKNKNDDLIYGLNFEGKPLYLYQLAVLAVLIHNHNTRYLLIENNCYHYAGTILKVLEQEYNVANSVDDTGAGKWWCGLVLYPGKSGGHASSLLERFREEVKKFVSFKF